LNKTYDHISNNHSIINTTLMLLTINQIPISIPIPIPTTTTTTTTTLTTIVILLHSDFLTFVTPPPTPDPNF